MQIIKGTLIAYILPENSLIYEIIYLEGGKWRKKITLGQLGGSVG